MRRDRFGPDDGDPLVFVLGWGNRTRDETVRWLVDHLVEAGYRVDAFEIPPHITDFESEWLDPVRTFVADLDAYRCLSHSTGGLISRYLEPDSIETRVYLSPWWAFHRRYRTPLLPLVAMAPIPWPVVPAPVTKGALGDLATDEQVRGIPDAMAPTFLREARRAQRNVPAFDPGDVVFYTPSDPIVGVDAIEDQVPPDNRVVYEGGHELVCSSAREDHLDTLLAAIDRGGAALR